MKNNKQKTAELERIRAQERAIIRQQMVDDGFFNKSTHQVHKDKKKYDRNQAKRQRYLD